jgi:hypothetical protein
MKVKRWTEEPQNFTGIIEFCDGIRYFDFASIRHLKCDQFHREDGPARIWPDNSKQWWLDGVYYHTENEWKIAAKKFKKVRLHSK